LQYCLQLYCLLGEDFLLRYCQLLYYLLRYFLLLYCLLRDFLLLCCILQKLVQSWDKPWELGWLLCM
jgi:hypothetical protein